MKKLLTAMLLVLAGFVLAAVLLAPRLPVRAGGAATPSGNGDVNGDGMIDVSDAVYTLLYLFKGGEPPVACADTPELVARVTELEGQLAIMSESLAAARADLVACETGLARCRADSEICGTELTTCKADLDNCLAEPPDRPCPLPDTGQSACYSFVEPQGWVEVPCGEATCPGQDGFYATGCPSEGRFVDNGDGTVTDNCTGLLWQKETADVNGDGRLTLQDYVQWCDALAYCKNLSFADHDDWRLPNVRELQSIVDYGRFNPAIDPVFGAFGYTHWSSTSNANGPGSAWVVGVGVGDIYGFNKATGNYVRAVRNAP
mgnify:CR=1 FL=1